MAKKTASKKVGEENGEKPEVNIEFGGKGLLGGFFKGLGSLIDLADKVGKEGGGIEKSGEFGIKGQKDMTGVYGFSIRTMAGPGGAARPVVRPFGDISKFKREGGYAPVAKKPKGPTAEEARGPRLGVGRGGKGGANSRKPRGSRSQQPKKKIIQRKPSSSQMSIPPVSTK